MAKNILEFIAEQTSGESYRTARFELDAEKFFQPIEPDAPDEIFLRHAGETRPTKNFVSLESESKNFSSSGLQILNYFLDGTRRVCKVDEIAYLHGARKMIYPIVAAQVVTGCCRRVEKKLHAEKFSDEIILVLPDDANYGEHEGFFPALVDKINARFKIKISKILSYSTNHNPAEKFEDRAVVKVMTHMHDTEINLVAELSSGAESSTKKIISSKTARLSTKFLATENSTQKITASSWASRKNLIRRT